MLRDLIAWVLNNYLGKYVENLNTTQLTVALLSGEQNSENSPKKDPAMSHSTHIHRINSYFHLFSYCNIAIHYDFSLSTRILSSSGALSLKFHFSQNSK